MNVIKVSLVPGDALSETATRDEVSGEELQRWNGTENPDFLGRSTIVVYTPMDAPNPGRSVALESYFYFQ